MKNRNPPVHRTPHQILSVACAAAIAVAVTGALTQPARADQTADELMLVNAKTGKCLTIAGGVSTENNVTALQFNCDSHPSRTWVLKEMAGGNVYQIRNVQTGKCLTIDRKSVV